MTKRYFCLCINVFLYSRYENVILLTVLILRCSEMKPALIYVFIACSVVMTSSQPTYEFSEDKDCDCQQLQSQIDAIKHYLQEIRIIKPLPSPRPSSESRKILSSVQVNLFSLRCNCE